MSGEPVELEELKRAAKAAVREMVGRLLQRVVARGDEFGAEHAVLMAVKALWDLRQAGGDWDFGDWLGDLDGDQFRLRGSETPTEGAICSIVRAALCVVAYRATGAKIHESRADDLLIAGVNDLNRAWHEARRPSATRARDPWADFK